MDPVARQHDWRGRYLMNEPTVVNRGRLMWASFLTLIAAGMGFGVRGGILADWGADFGFTMFELGKITGGGLIGFGLVILLASLFTDTLGYKTILMLAFVLHVLSLLVTLAATPLYASAGKDGAFQCLFWGMLLFSIANGLCEAVINPLISNIYPEKRTHYLNILHAGWPAGLILGGVLGLLLVGKVRWEIPIALYIIPVVWYGFLVLKEKFPESDVKKAGITYGQMLAEFASPVLLMLLLLHACVGYVELGTDSWITGITEMLTQQGFKLFIYASSIMFVLRFVAGPIVERINPLGLLCISSILGTAGLYMLGSAQTAVAAWVAVTIYGLGKTFLWPTMLGIIGERFPKGGAVTMGAIGGIGMLSAGFLGGPGIGYKQDRFASEHLRENAKPTYERYQADEENGFLFFSKVRGLDGKKVGVLLDSPPAKTINEDYAKFAKANKDDGTKIPAEIADVKAWWDETGKDHAAADMKPVDEAKIEGGRMALKLAAAVPAAMFVGYLILVLYFASQGGYTTVEIDAGKSPKKDGED